MRFWLLPASPCNIYVFYPLVLPFKFRPIVASANLPVGGFDHLDGVAILNIVSRITPRFYVLGKYTLRKVQPEAPVFSLFRCKMFFSCNNSQPRMATAFTLKNNCRAVGVIVWLGILAFAILPAAMGGNSPVETAPLPLQIELDKKSAWPATMGTGRVGASSKGDFCADSKGDRFRASIYRVFPARC